MRMKLTLLFCVFALSRVSAMDVECPAVPKGDVALLPLCSLKTTLGKINQCIFQHAPARIGDVTYEQCSERYGYFYDCIVNALEECDSPNCIGVLSGIPLPDGVNLQTYLANMRETALQLIIPYGCIDLNLLQYSPIRDDLFKRLAELASYGTEPICDNDFLPTLLKEAMTLIPTFFAYIKYPSEACSLLGTYVPQLANLTSQYCDWKNLTHLIPGNTLFGSINVPYLVMLIETAFDYYLEEVEIPQCQRCVSQDKIDSCKNGECRVDGYGEEYCECDEFYHGENCTELECPEVGEGDMPLFSGCSLHTFLAKGSECINRNYPFLDISNISLSQCENKLQSTVFCLANLESNCHVSGCEEVFPDVAWALLQDFILGELVNVSSPLRRDAFTLFCNLPYVNGTVLRPNKTFNIGFPVCPNNTIDAFVEGWVTVANEYFRNPYYACPLLDHLKYGIWNFTSSCNWDRISEVLPPNLQENSTYFSRLLNNAHGYFLNWVYPPCRGCERLVCQGEKGTCINAFGIEYCECEPYRSGLECEIVDPCYKYCENDGYCYSYDGNASCSCLPHTSGPRCEIVNNTICRYNYCYNGGTCLRNGSYEYCSCPTGYTGYYCEHYDGLCTYNYCINGGTCYRNGSVEFCSCPSGYTGYYCETPDTSCTYHYCSNGGSCFRNGSFEYCICPRGYTGFYCETPDVTHSECKAVTEYSSQQEYVESWMCEYKRYKNNLCEWKTEIESWWNTCPNFANAEFGGWKPWDGNWYLSEAPEWSYTRGWTGFSQVWYSAFECPNTYSVQCSSGPLDCFTDCNGCNTCYCPSGCYSNLKFLFNLWVVERRNSERQSAIHRSLKEQCIRSTSGGCPSTSTPFTPTGSTPIFTSFGPSSRPPPPFSSSTFSSPTMSPPTGSPPTMFPPTGSPPTMFPPTGSPPTMSPPTGSPPTMSPPTGSPPTMSPPTGTPASTTT